MLVMNSLVRFSTRPLVLVLIAASVMLFSGGTARSDAGGLYVAPSGSSGGSCGSPDNNTIQAAVDAAIPGDSLILCQDQYNESVVLREKHGILIQAGRDAVSFPERMLLESNLMYQNGAGKRAGEGGDIGGQTRDTLDATDSINYTTRGDEGPDGIAGCVFADCGAGHGLDETVEDPTGLDYHLAAQAAGAQRVGIVYSESTASNYFSEIVYSQMFMAMQNQVLMAGIPFDLLTENDLADVNQISTYDALVFPYFANCCVDDQGNNLDPDTIAANIVQSGAGIITFGDFMTSDPQGAAFCPPPYCNPYQHMIDVLGLAIIGSAGPVDVNVRAKANTHAVMKDYGANEIIIGCSQPSHPQTATTPPAPYIGNFTKWYGDAGGGARVEVLVDQDLYTSVDCIQSENSSEYPTTFDQTRAAVLAVKKDGARHVHFASDWLMGNSNLVWEAVQWSVYGDEDTPVGLKIGRQKSIFIARDDADSSKNPDEAALVLPGLEVLYEQWKNDYNFVGSNYINIGIDPPPPPDPDDTTGWGFNGPYYQDYIGLGHEIGTHSYTHPFDINLLTESELQFEFCDSKTQIESQLGITILGGSVPGAAESLSVDEIIDQMGCLSYLSGRYANVGNGYPGAIGYLNANATDDMVYFNPNMWPDFTAIQWHGWTAAQTEQEWGRQMDLLGKHASQPIVHMMWHDYGATTFAAANAFCLSFPSETACDPPPPGYTVNMYANTLKKAHDEDAEFATLSDIQQRFKTFQGASLVLTHAAAAPGEETITAAVTGSGVGQFSLEVNSRGSENKTINSVDNWYAYNEDRIFLDEDGGQFSIRLGAPGVPQDAVTRIVSLPMRASLQSVKGNGTDLDFTFQGEGKVSVNLNPLAGPLVATCDGTTTENGNVLEITFGSIGTHSCQIRAGVVDVTEIWRPAPGTSWQWQLTGTIDTSIDAQMYDIDLFDAPQSKIDQLHDGGRVVICYFSAGSWEDWRPDAGQFPNTVKGSSNGWPGEKWLDIRQVDILGPIMEARLDLAVRKKCDGVEPDNVDGYTNNTGLPLTYQNQLVYLTWLAGEAHSRNLSIGLKNDLDQVDDLVTRFDWALNEQCFQYNECELLLPFVNSGKAVFGVEYRGSVDSFCPQANAMNFDWLKKGMNLNATRTPCR
jgi:hypothetical protein